jgi:hypothetical protein
MRTAVLAELPTDIEDACLLIERLEIHRQCIDEALADAYADLISLLGPLAAGDPDLLRLLRARPWLESDAAGVTAGVSWLAACGSASRETPSHTAARSGSRPALAARPGLSEIASASVSRADSTMPDRASAQARL